ncbi:MAG: hypothetical protein ACRDJH_14375 [Thermomicrobiales bacterium]
MRGQAPAVVAGPIVPVRLAQNYVFEAGDYLGRAVADDPIVSAIVPVPSHRTRQALATASRHLVQYAERWGEVYTTRGRIDGLAVWLPPAVHQPVGLARGGAALLTALTAELETDDTFRLVGIGMRLARARRRAIDRPHWHLVTVSTCSPRVEEISDALIRPILERADAEGIPCFTASARAQQVLFFVRHGFQAVRDDLLTPRGPRVWSLVREPARGAISQ